MNIPTFNMSFYMSNLNMYTIDAIRAGIRTATTRCYYNEISKINGLSHGQPIKFIRIDDKTKQVVDSIIAFATKSKHLNQVGYKLLPYDIIINNEYIKQWCELEGWDESFANAYFTSNKDKELTRVIVFPTMYKMSLAKMREGMKCKVVLSTLDDGTLMVKEIK